MWGTEMLRRRLLCSAMRGAWTSVGSGAVQCGVCILSGEDTRHDVHTHNTISVPDVRHNVCTPAWRAALGRRRLPWHPLGTCSLSGTYLLRAIPPAMRSQYRRLCSRRVGR
eukprot:942594-Rhodomonas_salina.3